MVLVVVVVWHRQTQYPRAFTCAYKQRGGNYTYGNAGCRTYREREGLERRWKRWRRRRRRTRYGRAPLPRTKPDKYTIIYTLSETCISYLASQSTISHRRKWMSYKLLPITRRHTYTHTVTKIVTNLTINHGGEYKGNAFPRAECRSCFHPSRPRDKKLGPDGPTDE